MSAPVRSEPFVLSLVFLALAAVPTLGLLGHSLTG
jgi:hypothetical protein